MPRVIQILSRFVIGGPATITATLTKFLQPEFETLLIVGGKDDHEKDAAHIVEDMGIRVVQVEAMKRAVNPKLDYTSYQTIKKVIKEFEPDIVHTHSAKAGIIGRLAAKRCHVPAIIHTFHGHVFHSYFNKAKTNAIIQTERFLANISDGIVAISNQQKHELADVYKVCKPDKVKIIPLGLDIHKFQKDQCAKRRIFRSRYLIDEDEVAIGLVGRIVPIKNHDFFIDVAAEVLKKTNKKVRFVIIGDGDLRIDIESKIKEKKLDYCYFPDEQKKAAVICTSWITNIDFAFAGLDIVALTSLNEGTPVSLIEAQTAGKPVVSTNVGGVRDTVIDGKTGFLVNSFDVNTFANYLIKLLENPFLRKQMGDAGNYFATEKFSNERLLHDIKEYYHFLLNK
ncbi:MAG: glycosyltransferase family 4 protein [Ilyomonas sp.]